MIYDDFESEEEIQSRSRIELKVLVDGFMGDELLIVFGMLLARLTGEKHLDFDEIDGIINMCKMSGSIVDNKLRAKINSIIS